MNCLEDLGQARNFVILRLLVFAGKQTGVRIAELQACPLDFVFDRYEERRLS